MTLANTLSPPNVMPESATDTADRHLRWLRRGFWTGCLLAVATVLIVFGHPLFVRWQLRHNGWSLGNELPNGGFPEWIPDFVGRWFGRVEYANAHRTPKPDDVRSLRCFAHLKFLEFQNTDVSEANLAATSKLHQVRILCMSGGRVDEAGFGHLASLPRLERVELMRVSSLGNNAMEGIARLPALERLAVLQTPIDDDSLVYLRNLSRLSSLYLSDTNTGDRGLEHVSNCAQLKQLTLEKLPITERGILELKKLPTLKSLSLSENNVTSAALEELKSANQKLDAWNQ